jgi:fructose-bisphosphate aldolase class I
VNLNAINRLAQAEGRAPWSLSFSFGRSLQVLLRRRSGP